MSMTLGVSVSIWDSGCNTTYESHSRLGLFDDKISFLLYRVSNITELTN